MDSVFFLQGFTGKGAKALLPKVNWVPFILNNLHMKFESAWSETVQSFIDMEPKVTLWPKINRVLLSSWRKEHPIDFGSQWNAHISWPLTVWTKINWVPPLIMSNLHMKFESDMLKIVAAFWGMNVSPAKSHKYVTMRDYQTKWSSMCRYAW